MKRFSTGLVASLVVFSVFAQTGKENNTLLWKISGNGLSKPSYLFGTIHMLCEDDAGLSKNLQKIISDCDVVYFEVDLDNLFEMFGAMGKMKMLGDTTLRDLLNDQDYEKVKSYFESTGSMLPFSMLETFKPILAASTLEKNSLPCESIAMMEQVIMKKAKQYDKKIKGLETMAYQAGVLDSIPYKLQAEQLLKYVNSIDTDKDEQKQLQEMFTAYKNQDLQALEKLMIETDPGMAGFTDIMLYHRNQNWVQKLLKLLSDQSLLIAVGAGHLPGSKGLINLLRKEGFTLTPIENKQIESKVI